MSNELFHITDWFPTLVSMAMEAAGAGEHESRAPSASAGEGVREAEGAVAVAEDSDPLANEGLASNQSSQSSQSWQSWLREEEPSFQYGDGVNNWPMLSTGAMRSC